MEFNWTTEHADLRAAVRRVLATSAPVARNRELAESGARRDDDLWMLLAEQVGLPALLVPEEHGGVGGSLVDMAVVMEEVGAVLYGGPFLSSAVMATTVLSAHPDDALSRELLPRLAEGTLTATVAVVEASGQWSREAVATSADPAGRVTGSKHLVLDGSGADVVLVLALAAAGPTWFAVESGAPGLTVTGRTTLDSTRPMATLDLRDCAARRLGEEGAGWTAVEHLRRTAGTLLAAEQVGAAGELVRRTAEYATTRHQFGRPIGSFQGVKHRLADMAVRHELALSAAYWAAWQVPGSPPAELGSLVARSYCSDALLQTAKDAIQLHGGIGFTWEHDAHLFLRRARLDASLLGSASGARAALLAHLTEGAAA